MNFAKFAIAEKKRAFSKNCAIAKTLEAVHFSRNGFYPKKSGLAVRARHFISFFGHARVRAAGIWRGG
jgi:hypothetical protein